MKVYVLVKVDYDYYRFNYNYGVFSTIDEAKSFAEEKDVLDVYCYSDRFNESLDDPEKAHWQIQEWDVL